MPRSLSLNNRSKQKSKFIYIILFAMLAVLLASISFNRAYMHQSPVGCNTNRLNLSIHKDKTKVRNGDTINYTVIASNLDANGDVACDITDADITLQLPAADGTPTGTIINVANDVDFPGNTPVAEMGTVPYVVDVNPDVVDIVVEGHVTGVLHDAPADHSAEIVKTLGTSVLQDEEEPEPEDDVEEEPSDEDDGNNGGGESENSPSNVQEVTARRTSAQK